MDFVIVIPTYDRSDNFKTIKFLTAQNVPDELITIFLANEEEKTKYRAAARPDNRYNWVVGVLGIRNQRNFITDYFPEGQIIVSIDDDIIDIVHKDNKPFMEWLPECIAYLRESNLGLMSVSPSSNPYFFQVRNKTVSFKKGCYLAVGVFHIFKNHREHKITIDLLDDYDRSMMFMTQYGVNARYMDVFLKTVYWGKGGLSSQRTLQYYENQVESILAKYPGILKTRERLVPQMSKTQKIPIVYISRRKSLDVKSG